MTETVYAYYPVFRLARAMNMAGPAELSVEANEVEAPFAKWQDRCHRGVPPGRGP